MIDKLGEVGMPVTHDDMEYIEHRIYHDYVALPISKWLITTTLTKHSKRNGHLTSRISLTIQKYSDNTRRITELTIKLKIASQMKTHLKSRAMRFSSANYLRTCHPGKRSTTI